MFGASFVYDDVRMMDVYGFVIAPRHTYLRARLCISDLTKYNSNVVEKGVSL